MTAYLSKKEDEIKVKLNWYFTQSQSAIGYHSNWGEMQFSSHSHHPDPYNDGMLENISKRRQIEKVFFKLPILNQRVLYSCLADLTFPKEVKKMLNKFSGAAMCLTNYQPEQIYKLCQKLVQNAANATEQNDFLQLQQEAQKLYHQSIQLFMKLDK